VIIKIHGTSGSGKTTIIRELMKISDPPVTDFVNMTTGKVEGHLLHLPGVLKPVVVLGPYGKAHCGGLDAVSGTDNHVVLLRRYVVWGHVLYEGLLGSECYGAMGVASEQYGDEHVFAFLDTPIETCIQRVKDRRAEKGNLKPLNEDNTRDRVKKIAALEAKLKRMGKMVVSIPHGTASETVHRWLLRGYV
jgi:thymidylate kinase